MLELILFYILQKKYPVLQQPFLVCESDGIFWRVPAEFFWRWSYSGLHNKKGYRSPGTKKYACRPLLVLSVSLARSPLADLWPDHIFFRVTYFKENGTPWWPAAMGDCIACGTATSKPLRAASSPHHGRCPSASVLLESMVGASNWGGSAEAISIDFFHPLLSFPVIVRHPIL